MYTFADVPKHRLYYCAHTNRYTDTVTCCAHQLDGSPGSIKRSFILSGKLQTHLNVGSFFYVCFVWSFVNSWKAVWPQWEVHMLKFKKLMVYQDDISSYNNAKIKHIVKCNCVQLLTALNGMWGHLERDMLSSGLRYVHAKHKSDSGVFPTDVRLALPQLDVGVPELQDPSTVDAATRTKCSEL